MDLDLFSGITRNLVNISYTEYNNGVRIIINIPAGFQEYRKYTSFEYSRVIRIKNLKYKKNIYKKLYIYYYPSGNDIHTSMIYPLDRTLYKYYDMHSVIMVAMDK